MPVEWKQTAVGNFILQMDDFWISYNPDAGGSAATVLGGPRSRYQSDGGGEETALCHNGRFDILNGDFRESYERLAPEGLDACRAFYRQQSAHADSSWTTPSVAS